MASVFASATYAGASPSITVPGTASGTNVTGSTAWDQTIGLGPSLSVSSHPLSSQEARNLQSIIGTLDPQKNYDDIVDGHGTGLAPPTSEEWNSSVGNVSVVDSVESDLIAPSSWDLSTSSYFPAVGNQGTQGSCAAWAATYYDYGYLVAEDSGWLGASSGNSSELLSPAWTYDRVNGGSDRGSYMFDNMEVAATWGVPTLSTMPYNQNDCTSWGSQDAFREAPDHQASVVYSLPYNGTSTVVAVKSLVSSGIPVTFAIDANQFNYAFSDGKYIISAADYSSTTVDHAQTIVGFDDHMTDDGDIGAFKVVNSWGASWGNHGYYWITYNAFMKIGDLLQLTYLYDRADYEPSLIAVWHFDSPPTRDASLTLSAINTQTGTDLADVCPYYFSDKGHTFPSFMCYDISALSAYLNDANVQVELKVGNSFRTGVISSFKMESYSSEYLPGVAQEISDQSIYVPQTTPGQVYNSPPDYSSVASNTALDDSIDVFYSSGDASWVSENSQSSHGGYAMQSGDLGDGGHSTINTSVVGPGSISFEWRVSSQSGFDFLSFYLDGTLVSRISGNAGWTLFDLSFGAGTHSLKWVYSKDASLSMGADCGWLDHVDRAEWDSRERPCRCQPFYHRCDRRAADARPGLGQ